MCRGAPILTHLLFADDCFLFFRATKGEVNAMKAILETFADASGLTVNFTTSEAYFSKNVG